MIGSAIVWTGILLLIHASFSAVHYKELATVAGIELEADFLPWDVKLETLIGVVVAIFGAILNAGKLYPIDGSALLNKETWEQFWDNSNFRIYNHRANALAQRLGK